MIPDTERLQLREFTSEDLDSIAPLMADPEVMRYSVSGPLSESQVEEFLRKRIIDHYAKFGFGLYAAIHKQDQALIGFTGLLVQNIDGEDRIELGYRLSPKYWGKGLATEAAKAVLHYAFQQLKIDELISIIDPKNTRSVEVAKRVGMNYWKQTLFHDIPVHVYFQKNILF